jgi:hypothetical protein
VIINLCSTRRISYRLNELDNIDKIEYIVSFPSGYKHSFPVHLDKDNGELIINLPILKEIIVDEFDGIGYVQITKSSGMIAEYFAETVRFVLAESIELSQDDNKEINFNNDMEPINKLALRTNEVVVSHSNTLQFIMSNINRDKK